jgi:hypothetical protein
MQRSEVFERFEKFFSTRKISRVTVREDGERIIARCYIYAFRKPSSKSYRRFRLGDREFNAIARMIRVRAEDVRADYLARGGQLASTRRRRVA